MSELKACPFCGGEAVCGQNNINATCKNKECLMFPSWYPIEKWNTRPIESALQSRIAELEERIETLTGLSGNIIPLCQTVATTGNIPAELTMPDDVLDTLLTLTELDRQESIGKAILRTRNYLTAVLDARSAKGAK